MRPLRLVIALMVILATAACAHAPPQVAVAPASDIDSLMYADRDNARAPVAVTPAATLAAPMVAVPAVVAPVQVAAEQPYTLGPGDKLRIVVFGQEGLTNSYVVDAAGNVTMPLIGAVKAGARTTPELARIVAERLRNGYVREPHVAIEVEAYRPFFILGEVTAPGQYPFVPNMTVETAVAIAGGFSPRAFRGNAKISRTVNGQQFGGTVPLNYPIHPGDTISVGERWF